MLVSEISTMLKFDLVNKGSRYYGIGDHIEVVCGDCLFFSDGKRGCAGALTRIEPDTIRITDYNGNDTEIEIADIEEVIDD